MSDEQPNNPFEVEAESPAPENGPEEALDQGTPSVAAKAGKTYVAFAILGVVVLGLLYSIFSGGGETKTTDTKPKKVDIEAKIDTKEPPLPKPPKQTEFTPELPEVTPIPGLDTTGENTPFPPIAPPPTIPNPVKVPLPDLDPEADAAARAQAQQRLRSKMMVVQGDTGGSLSNLAQSGRPSSVPTDPNSQFAAAVGSTKAERVDATRITTLHRTIAQGRIIQATLETAINTDLPAPIRAIVSVDTYGESGTVPLIPKGSRLIGTYNTTITTGQSRVFVVWQRVIRPDGVDVQLGSPLIDAIGQAGVAGQLDTKFQEIFARSLVSSVMNIAMAIGTDEISGGGSTTTTTSTTGSQTSGDAVTTATTNALNRLGSTTDGFISRFLQVPPTILVDQGTKVNVMVNKDILFSEDASGVRILN